MDVGRKRRNTRRFIVLTLIFVMFDWGVVDRWGVKGAVFDAVSGAPIEDAWVIATFDGETPWLRIPLGPHPSHRTSRCMGTRVTKTDRSGRFGFDVLTFNRALANKTVGLMVFKPGFVATRGYSSLSSSLLGFSPRVRLSLRAGPGDRVQTTKRVPEFPWSRLPAEERTRSDLLLGTQITIIEVMSKCGGKVSRWHELPWSMLWISHARSMSGSAVGLPVGTPRGLLRSLAKRGRSTVKIPSSGTL